MVKKAPGNPGLFLCPAGTGPKNQQTLGSDFASSVFGEAFYKRYSGFADKWHGHLARDHWTSSAGLLLVEPKARRDADAT